MSSNLKKWVDHLDANGFIQETTYGHVSHHGQYRVHNFLPQRDAGTDVSRGHWTFNIPEYRWQAVEISHRCNEAEICSFYAFCDLSPTDAHVDMGQHCEYCRARVDSDSLDYLNKAFKLYHGLA